MTTPAYALRDGNSIPAIGLGTYGLDDQAGIDAITTAIADGYRLIDTAYNYGNEEAVGEAIRRTDVDRSDLRHHHQAARPAPRLRRDPRELRAVAQEARPRLGRPLPHPLAAAARRQVRRQLARDDLAAREGARALDRRLELHARHAHAAHRRDERRARGEPGRAASVLPAGGTARIPRRARHPHRELEPAGQAQRAAAGARRSPSSPPRTASRRRRWCCAGTSSSSAVPIPKSSDAARRRENLDVFGFALTTEEVDADLRAVARAPVGRRSRHARGVLSVRPNCIRRRVTS